MTADLRVDHADWLLTLDDRRRIVYNPVANLVYSATGKSVHTVIVDGRVVEAGRALTLDEAATSGRRRRAPAILVRTGLAAAVAPRWPVE